MKFASKLIIGTTLIISILFSLESTIMIRENFQVSYNNLVEQNTKKHILYRYSVESNIRRTLENNKKLTKEVLIRSIDKFVAYEKKSEPTGVIWNNELVYSDIEKKILDEEVISYYKNNRNSYLVKEIDKKIYMYLSSEIQVSNENITLLNIYDITDIFTERERQNEFYLKWLLIIIIVYIITVTIFANFLIKPIKKLNKVSKRIYKGNFNERTNINSKDEIGELSKSFDIMAASIEEYIQKLLKDVKNREDFISNFSHELKTPMTSMMGYSRLLMKEDCNKEIQKKSANYIYSECKRLEALSKCLLKLQEIDNLPLELVSISTDWLKERLDLVMEPLIKGQDVTWINCFDSSYIKGDAQLLIILLKNLIENGLKASDGNIYISVNGIKRDKYYEISVEDHGTGIEAEKIEKVIEPFYMLDKSRSRKTGNFGVGLAICDKIAKAHNTKLEIYSKVGEGTKIIIKLEVDDEEITC